MGELWYGQRIAGRSYSSGTAAVELERSKMTTVEHEYSSGGPHVGTEVVMKVRRYNKLVYYLPIAAYFDSVDTSEKESDALAYDMRRDWEQVNHG